MRMKALRRLKADAGAPFRTPGGRREGQGGTRRTASGAARHRVGPRPLRPTKRQEKARFRDKALRPEGAEKSGRKGNGSLKADKHASDARNGRILMQKTAARSRRNAGAARAGSLHRPRRLPARSGHDACSVRNGRPHRPSGRPPTAFQDALSVSFVCKHSAIRL